MTRPNRLEDAIQRVIFQHLDVRGVRDCVAFHVPNGGWRSPAEASILKGLGVRAGIPDIIAIKNGRAYGLELKAPGGRLTATQRDAHVALAAAGATVATAALWGLLRGRAAGSAPLSV
jgi:hypothetical protein